MNKELEIDLELYNDETEIDINQSEEIRTGNPIKDYEKLENKPKIEGNELIGNKSFSDLGLQILTNLEIENLINNQN